MLQRSQSLALYLLVQLIILTDVPIHATIATLVFLSLDRYLLLVRPSKARLPPFIAVLGVWVLSVCIVLPYTIYINYFDLQTPLGKQFEGVGLCMLNLGDDIAEYIRGLFVVMYVVPLALITFLHVRISNEINRQEAPVVNLSTLDSRDPESQQDIYTLQDNRRTSRTIFQESDRSSRSMYQENSAILSEVDGREEYLLHDSHQLPSFLTPTSNRTAGTETPVGHTLDGSHGIDFAREKRSQKYIATMTVSIAICLCPLMILKLVKNMVLETYDNSGHFDITYITFVWMAFLPTVSTPALFAAWRMPRSTQERLEGYLRFSNRSHRSSSHGGQHLPSNLHSFHPRAEYRLSLERPPVPVSPHTHPYSPVASHDRMLRQDIMTTDLATSYSDMQQRPQSLALAS